jgi:HIV-1 Vpr-binding protein
LRTQVSGDVTSSQKDANLLLGTKHPRGRDENRSKVRFVQDSSVLDGTRAGDGILTDPTSEKDLAPCVVMRQADSERLTDDTVDMPQADGLMRSTGSDMKTVYGEKHPPCESLRDEHLKRKLSRTGSRLRGESKTAESLTESERTPLSPTSGLRIGNRAS